MDNKNSWIKDWKIQSDKDEIRQNHPDNLRKLKTDSGQNTGEETRIMKSLWPWIMTAGLAVVALVITLVITITSKGKDKEEIQFVNQVENVVNRTDSLSASFDASGWNNADAEKGENKEEVPFDDHVENFVNRPESLSSSFDASGWDNADAEKRDNKEKVPFVNQVENFVNRTESLSSSFDASRWNNADAEFGAHLTRYKRIYDSLSTSELDRVDDAIERYTILCRRYRGTPAGEKSSFVVDDIEYSYSNPTIDQLHQWKNQYASICTTKLKNMYFQDFSIPNGMKEKDPCLVYLLMKTGAISKEEKQNWFNLYLYMNDEKVDKLYDILYREKYKIAGIEKKYEIKKQVNQLNAEAYKYVKAGDFYNAYITIDHAIALEPDNPNLYDSKGEFYLMQGRLSKARSMWNKVLETDSNFLDMYGGHTNLYDGLVEKGMINR